MAARETALNVLMACRVAGAWSNGILKEYTLRDRLDRREAALAARLCYGVLQNRMKLDFYLGQLLKTPVKRLHPAVRDILHLGLYQLFELDKIPESAAVNEAVALTKKYCRRQPSAAALVNGVLRNALRQKDTLQQPTSWEDKYSHPEALLKLLKAYVPKAAMEPMLRANNAIPPTVVQTNTLKTTTQALAAKLEGEGVTVQAHSWLPDCLVLSGTGSIEHLESFRKGLFYVQDAAARLSVLCAQLPQEPLQVLDCCAAPGGKSFAAAIAMGGRGQIHACDIHSHKTELIAGGAARLGLPNVQVEQQDASQFRPEWENAMDVVIADVPCSGYGIIRKKPDIRYKDPASMQGLPALQLAILSNQARYVKPGGTLLYSTCTLVRQENEGVLEAFLQENHDFTLQKLPLPAPLPENESGMLALFPGQYDTDGFFISRLRRKL